MGGVQQFFAGKRNQKILEVLFMLKVNSGGVCTGVPYCII